MKSLYYCTLLLTTLLFQPALAQEPTPELAAMQVGTRPLMRYLTATLRLPKARVLAVQQALQAHPLQVRTPEQIIERLHTVLLPQEYYQFQALAGNAVTYENLRALSVR